MATKPLYEEVIDEIGTQTLARFGLNIFSFSSYAAYGASVTMTNDVARSYGQHKANTKGFGHYFEELDSGLQNVADSFLNTGNKTYTTDTLADIKYVQGLLASKKKLENLQPKDRAKVEHVLANYGDEVKNMDFQWLLDYFAQKNHNTTDTVTFDEYGNIVNTSQLKAVKDTNKLLKDRYLFGLVHEIKVPFDDYKKHKEQLEKWIEEGRNSKNPKTKERAYKAGIALRMLNANNVCNRLMCENPRFMAVATQAGVGIGHAAQAGMSDAVVVAMSTLASGIVWEVKDMYASRAIDSDVTIMARIERLLKRVMDTFKSTFVRGAGFGAIDAIMGIIGQIFTSVASSLKVLWKNMRASAKSIYNGIYSYVDGKITNMRELLSTILKSIFSAAWVVPVIALEQKLALILPFGSLFAPIFAIVAGAFAVVLTYRSIDMALDSIFTVLIDKNEAKLRTNEIAELIAENLPTLVNEREELTRLIEATHQQRLMSLESSFADYQQANIHLDSYKITESLENICRIFGGKLPIKTMGDVRNVLQNTSRTGKLQWVE